MERWRQISGLSRYEISDFGRVRSLFRTYGVARPQPYILKHHIHATGHHHVALTDDTGRVRRCLVHRLVLTAFERDPLPHEKALHRDDDPSHNNLSNLYWGTQKQNMLDMVRNGHQSRPSAVLTEDMVRSIRMEKKCGVTYRELSDKYGVTQATLCDLVKGRTWSDVQ